jgi:hypothetical protein
MLHSTAVDLWNRVSRVEGVRLGCSDVFKVKPNRRQLYSFHLRPPGEDGSPVPTKYSILVYYQLLTSFEFMDVPGYDRLFRPAKGMREWGFVCDSVVSQGFARATPPLGRPLGNCCGCSRRTGSRCWALSPFELTVPPCRLSSGGGNQISYQFPLGGSAVVPGNLSDSCQNEARYDATQWNVRL